MKRITKLFFNLLITCMALLLFNCSNVTIYSDYDADTDFASYNTFSVCLEDMEVTNKDYPLYDNTFNRKHIQESVTSEMKKRGYTFNDTNAELQIGYQIVITDRETTVTDCRGDRKWHYWPGCTVETYNYTEGTLVINISDIDKNQVIWQGSANGALRNVSPDKVKKAINKSIEQIFLKYPKDHLSIK